MRSILLDHFGIETRHMLSTVAAAVPMAAARASGRRPRLWPRLAAKDQFVIRIPKRERWETTAARSSFYAPFDALACWTVKALLWSLA